MLKFISSYRDRVNDTLKVAGVLGLLLAGNSCARVQDPLIPEGVSYSEPTNATETPSPDESESPPEDPGYLPVSGEFRFGSVCPLGNLSDPESAAAGLWDCEASGLESLRLKSPAPIILMQADCRKRLVTVRVRDLDFEVTWQVLPDGRFSIPLERRPQLLFAEDGSGMGECAVESLLTLSGEIQCDKPDQPKIRFDSVWLLNPPEPAPAPVPSVSPSAAPSPAPSSQPSSMPSMQPSTAPSPIPSASPIAGPRRDFRVVVNRACRFERSCFLHAPHRLEQCR
jgi:hypothetical protein